MPAKVIRVTFVIFILCDRFVAYATALKEQPSKHIKDPETLNMTYSHSSISLTLKYQPYNYEKVYVSAYKSVHSDSHYAFPHFLIYPIPS